MNISYDLTSGEIKVCGIPVTRLGGLSRALSCSSEPRSDNESKLELKFKARLTTVLAISTQCYNNQFAVAQDAYGPGSDYLIYKGYQEVIQDFIKCNLQIADVESKTDDVLLMQMYFNGKLQKIHTEVKSAVAAEKASRKADEKASRKASEKAGEKAAKMSEKVSEKAPKEADVDKDDVKIDTDELSTLFKGLSGAITNMFNSTVKSFTITSNIPKEELPTELVEEYSAYAAHYTYDESATAVNIKIKSTDYDIALDKIKEIAKKYPALGKREIKFVFTFSDNKTPSDCEDKMEDLLTTINAVRSEVEVEDEVANQLDEMRE